MPDGITPADGQPADNVAGTDTATDGGGKQFEAITSQEALDKIIGQRLAREKHKAAETYADYDQLKADSAELAKIREANKTELQKAAERAEAAEKRAAAAEFTALRSKVAAAKGVPASSLTGTTEDELAASADELIAWRDQNTKPAPDPKTRPSVKNLKSGTTGADIADRDPKAAAVEALRRMRLG